jgi:hypothetical protein
MREPSSDCYIEVWRDVNFRGEMIRIGGPAEYPNLRFLQGDWEDDIGSLRVGPNAFVMAYRGQDFTDDCITFGPNDEIADLRELRFNDGIDSIKVVDSIKIFDRLAYHSKEWADATAADSAAGEGGLKRRGYKKKRHKGNRRR